MSQPISDLRQLPPSFSTVTRCASAVVGKQKNGGKKEGRVAARTWRCALIYVLLRISEGKRFFLSFSFTMNISNAVLRQIPSFVGVTVERVRERGPLLTLVLQKEDVVSAPLYSDDFFQCVVV